MTTTLNQSDDKAWETRAHAAALDLEAHRQIEPAKVELRDNLVIEGVDAGRSISQVAHALRISNTRVMQILAARG